MNPTALWIVQIVLAFAFFMSGLMKLVRPHEQVKQQMKFAEDFSPSVVKAIGAVEVLGAIGVIVPALTGILPWLTPLAAAGLALTMLGAGATHIRRHELVMLVPNLVLLALALIVIYGRLVALPVA